LILTGVAVILNIRKYIFSCLRSVPKKNPNMALSLPHITAKKQSKKFLMPAFTLSQLLMK